MKLRVTSDTLVTLSQVADRAAQRIQAARNGFAGQAAGIGSGFEDGGLESRYNEAYDHGMKVADAYVALLERYRDMLRTSASRYAEAEHADASVLRPS
jgi:uncharacterized protein YukE